MKRQTVKKKRGPYFFGLIGVIGLSLCFILSPLGSFVVWIFGGTAVFCSFMTIYLLIPIAPAKYSRKMDPKVVEKRAYIAYHLPLVISLLLGGLLIAVIVIFFAA